MDVETQTNGVATKQSPGASSSSKSSSKQHTREASVDMLTTNGNSEAASTKASSVSADQEMEDAVEIPSIDEQVNIIMQEMSVQLEDGMIGYVVASAWINRVLARSSKKDDHGPFEKDVLEGEVGPIDNTSIVLPRRWFQACLHVRHLTHV